MKEIKPTRYEVITTTDKAQRDRLYLSLKYDLGSTPEEQQVVKFSGAQPVLEPTTGKPLFTTTYYLVAGAKNPKAQLRPVYQSTWSVAYPMQKGAAL